MSNSKLILSVSIMLVFLYGVVQAASGRLATNVTTNGGCEGAYFNVTALNEDIYITGFAATVVGNVNARVYYKPGRYQGSQTDASDWDLLGSQRIAGGSGPINTLYRVDIGGVTIPEGETYGFLFYTGRTGTTTLATRYRTGATVRVSNDDIAISAADGDCGGDDFRPFDGFNADRAWNGVVYYGDVPKPHGQILDGRINRFDLGTEFVIYPHQDDAGETGLIIYDGYNENTDPESLNRGLLAVSAAQIAAVPEYPETNALIAMSADGRVAVYRLTDGQFQVQGSMRNGKTYVVIFRDIDRQASYTSYDEQAYPVLR